MKNLFSKIISFLLLIAIFAGILPTNNVFADIVEDQVLTAPNPTFVENQVQPVSSFNMNRYLLGYNKDLNEKTYIKQVILLDRNNFGGLSFRISRVKELKTGETAEKLKLTLLQDDVLWNEQVIDTKEIDGVSSISKTEVKWAFDKGIEITPNKELFFKIEVLNPDNDENTFPYYIYGEEDFENKPLYFGNLIYFDGESEKTTSDILGMSILRADNNNLGVPIESDYKYSKLIAKNSNYLNASNIEVISDNSMTRLTIPCSTLNTDSMVYRPVSDKEFENLLRHSMYFNTLIDKVGTFSEATYVSTNNYYLFEWMDNEALKENRYFTTTDLNNTVWTRFAFCVYQENQNLVWETKQVNSTSEQEIAMTGLNYDTSLYLTNKSPSQKIVTLEANKSIFNTFDKTIEGEVLDTGMTVQWGSLLKVFGRIAVNNTWFHDGNGYYNENNLRQWNIAYKIGNSNWKLGNNINEINETGRLYLSVVDNDKNLSNNLGNFKVVVDKAIVTNSIRGNNNLYFNVNKNINEFSVKLGETTDWTDYTSLVNTPFTKSDKIKIKWIQHIYENKYPELINTKTLAFDGSYFYTIKNNVLYKIGSGYNETIIGDIEEYTLSSDVWNILSMVSVGWKLYIGYNNKWLNTYIWELEFISGSEASIKNTYVEDWLLQNDIGDITNRKLDKNRYLLTADDKYIYNISYLSGDELQWNNANIDNGYVVKIFDPSQEMSLIKNIIVDPILDKDGNVKNKIGYYTEGAFVDRNYLYIIEDNNFSEDSNVVILDKVTFELIGKTKIKQNTSDCNLDSNETSVYSCAKTGVYDMLNDKLVLLSGVSWKLNFYNINKDNLIHYRLSKDIDLDSVQQEKSYLIKYNYTYNKHLTTEANISRVSGETISNWTNFVDLWYKLSNNRIEAVVGDIVRDYDTNTINKELSAGLVKLTKNTGNSSSYRINDRGINFSTLSINWVVQKWRGDYWTVSRIEDKSFVIKGERDNKSIVPIVKYSLNENEEYIKMTLSFRNDSSVVVENNNAEYLINLGWNYDYIDERLLWKNSIGETSKEYVVADDLETDDSLFFAITENANQRLGVTGGTVNNIKLMVKNFALNPWEEQSFDFFIGSKSDIETNESFFNKVKANKDILMPYSVTDNEDINKKLLTTSISKTDRLIISPEIGVDEWYTYESNDVNIISRFEETFDEDRVDSEGLPLSSNGWWSDSFKRSSDWTMSSTIQNSAGNGKIATLELVKYIPENTKISFDISWTTDSSNDKVRFFIDDTEYNLWSGNISGRKEYSIAKGLHIFTWKYGKDQFTGSQNDIIKIDNVTIWSVLNVFGDSCSYSGAALFYTVAYYNNFSKIETSNGDSHTYRTSICQDELAYSHAPKNTREWPAVCNEEDIGQWTHNGITVRTNLGDTNGARWDTSRKRAFGFYVAKYGEGQVAAANQFVDNCMNGSCAGSEMYYDIRHPWGSGELKTYFDGLYGPWYWGEDYLDFFVDGSRVWQGGNTHYYLAPEWRTKIYNNEFENNETLSMRFNYWEWDGGDDGATFFDNLIMKIKDPKSGCQMSPLAYNDKMGTHFIVPWYNMQTSSDRSKDTRGVVHIMSMEADTFVEIQKVDASTGDLVWDKQFIYNERIWQKLSFNVEEGFNYEVVTNKNVSLLMDNFYPDLTRTWNTTNDNTPTYDVQNGNNFVVLMPWNKYKKWNLFISHYEKDKDTLVKIKDLTNNKTNYEVVLSAGGDEGPSEIDTSISWTSTLSVWSNFTVYIDKDGKLFSVWENPSGLWHSITTGSVDLIEVDMWKFEDRYAVSVKSGKDHTIVLDNKGFLYSFWNNDDWELARWGDTKTPYMISTGVLENQQFTDISAWNDFSMFLNAEWQVFSVWNNTNGQLCNWNKTSSSTPSLINNEAWWTKKIKRIFSSIEWTTYFVDQNNDIYGCGSNTRSELWVSGEQLKPILIDWTGLWEGNSIKTIEPLSGYIVDWNGVLYKKTSSSSGYEIADSETFGTLPVRSIANEGNTILLENGTVYNYSGVTDEYIAYDSTSSWGSDNVIWIYSNEWGNVTGDLISATNVTAGDSKTLVARFTTPTEWNLSEYVQITFELKSNNNSFYHHGMWIKDTTTWVEKKIIHYQWYCSTDNYYCQDKYKWDGYFLYRTPYSNTPEVPILNWRTYELYYSTYYTSWNSVQIRNIRSTTPINSIGLENIHYVTDNNEIYAHGPNAQWELWLWHKNITSEPVLTLMSSNLGWNVDANDGTGAWVDLEEWKPYRSLKWIGEWQILKIESTNPITIYYGLWDKPAISELISPNSQTFYYPILWNTGNVSDYNSQMYTYYDLNLAKIQNYKWYSVKSGTINIGDDISSGINDDSFIGTWNKAVSTWPVWVAVWNKSSSFNYLYPIRSSKKLFGIGNQYMFNNVNANKLIITADTNNGNDVNFTVTSNTWEVSSHTLLPLQTLIKDIDPNTFYTIETSDENKHLYAYAQRWDNVRNTFSTVFKSREDKQLTDKIIKNNIGDKYVKYSVVGDFDYIKEEPKEVWNINIRNTMFDTDNGLANTWDLTEVYLDDNEKLVTNGIYSMSDSTPQNMIVDDYETWRYINGMKYNSKEFTDINEWIYYERETKLDEKRFLWGWIIHKNPREMYTLWLKDNTSNDNWPNGIYKIYDKNVYFPEISWEALYYYVKPTGNRLDISLNDTWYFGKRNLSQKQFDFEFNNWTINVNTSANSNEFTDTYFIPVIRTIDEDTIDFVEINKVTNFNFTRNGSDYWTVCVLTEDNNQWLKNICYTNSVIQWSLRDDLTNIGRIKSIDETLTNHSRNIYSDYIEIFNDWTRPMKVLGIEFTGVKRESFTTTFSDIHIENYTDVNPELYYKPNINIYSPETPLTHSLRVWILDIQRGAELLSPVDAELQVNLDNVEVEWKRVSFEYEGLSYNMEHIKDEDTLNEDMEESYYNGNKLFPLEEKQDYILYFRAKWNGLKQIQLVNQDDSKVYVNSLFTPREFTGNLIEEVSIISSELGETTTDTTEIIEKEYLVEKKENIFSDNRHSFFIDNKGKAYWSWGNNFWKLGDGSVIERRSPVLISNIAWWTNKIVSISSNDQYTLFLDNKWIVYGVWYINWNISYQPIKIDLSSIGNKWIKQIAAWNWPYILLLDNEWNVYNYNSSWNINKINWPWGGLKITKISDRWWRTAFFIDENWSVYWIWENISWQLWDGTFTNRSNPILIDNNSFEWKIIKISNSSTHTIFLDELGNIYTTWYNYYWQLWNWNSNNLNRPNLVNWIINWKNIIDISAGEFHSLMNDVEWNVYAMWSNSFRQLWVSWTGKKELPFLIDPNLFQSKKILEVSAWHYHSLFLTDDWIVFSTWSWNSWQLSIWYNQNNVAPIVVDSSIWQPNKIEKNNIVLWEVSNETISTSNTDKISSTDITTGITTIKETIIEDIKTVIITMKIESWNLFKETKTIETKNTTVNTKTGIFWNMLDVWDFYSIKFKTNWDENENVKVKFQNHSWDIDISEIRILKLQDIDFNNTELVKQGDWTFLEENLPYTWKLPTVISNNKKGNLIGESVFKNVSYFWYDSNSTRDWTSIENETELEEVINLLETDSNETLYNNKVYNFITDRSIINTADSNKFSWKGIDILNNMIYSEKIENKKVRIWLVWAIKLNWTYIYKNLINEQSGCIDWTWEYADYLTDNIKAKNCLVDFNFQEGVNDLVIYSIYANETNALKWFYKDTSFNFTSEWNGETDYELLTYWTEPWMPVLIDSFIPVNTKLSNSVDVIWNYSDIGIVGKEIEAMSVQKIDRDYSIPERPVLLNTDVNRNKDNSNVIRLVEFGINRNIWLDNGVRVSDYIKSDDKIENDTVSINLPKTNNYWTNKNDVLEMFVRFPNKPEQFNIELTTNTETQNIFWWENYIFTEEIDGKNIVRVNSLDNINENEWYKLHIPLKNTILNNDSYQNIKVSTFNGDVNISEITILKDKLLNTWNNVRITFDVDILDNTQKRDIIFGLTNNSTLLNNQWYEVIFSKNWSTTEILKNGVVIWSVTNDISYIKDDIKKYRLMLVKNKNKLYVSAKYDYIDTDWILKVKVDNILEVEDSTPLNLKNSKLVFKNDKNVFRVSNIRIEDGEDNEKISFMKFKANNQNYGVWELTVYNDKWESDSLNFQLYDNLEDLYVSMTNLSSYNGVVTDVVVKPNELNSVFNTYNIHELSLIKESETPSTISINANYDKLGQVKVNSKSNVRQVFTNTKEYIMWFTVFVSKATNLTQPEWLTLRLYRADSNWNPEQDSDGNNIVIAEKTVNTDAVKTYPNISPLKIVFPQVSVIDNQDYIVELSTNNSKWLYVFWNVNNLFENGYAYSNKKEYPFAESFEFNEMWNRTYGSKWSIGYLWSTLNGTDVPERVIVSNDNLKVIWKADKQSTITYEHENNQSIYYNWTIIINWNITSGKLNDNPLILSKEEEIDGEMYTNYKLYMVWNKLAWSFGFIWTDETMDFITLTDYADEDISIAVSIDTYKGFIKVYKNNVLKDTIPLDPRFIGAPLDTNNWKLKIMWNHTWWNNDMELDFVRIYNTTLNIQQIEEGSKAVNEYKYLLPYDIGFYMISKSSEVESVEERTYDLWVWKIHEVTGDLILQWYDSWDGVNRLILKWNSTFRVKWNIFINADEVLVVNDNSKEWDEAISYIWFVSDNDIIVSENVTYIQGWYYSKNSFKAELSKKQLVINWLLSGYETDFQNRIYLQKGQVCSEDEKENCSVVIEFDKRIYKRMPPLFFESDDNSWIEITEE